MLSHGVLLAHAASTLLLAGLIWTVQLVHYPAFRYVAEEDFTTFAVFHQRGISFAVVPLMLVELATAFLLFAVRPATLPISWLLAGAALTISIWTCTFAVQVPLHNTLSRGYDPDAIERLVQTNWIRTVLWSLRAGLVIAFLWLVIAPQRGAA